MADDDKEISDLDLAASFTGAVEFYGVLGGLDKRFNGAQVLDYIGAATFASPNVVSAGDFGLIADGGPHPLSERYATLADAQEDYYFATDLTQQIDYCACKKASNVAFGGDLEVLTAYVEVSQASDDTHIYDTDQSWTVNEHAGKTAFRKFISNGFITSQTILSNTATIITLTAPMPFGEIGATNEYALGYGEHGSAGATSNKKIFLPNGSYWFGDDTWLIRNLASGVIEGNGRLATTLRGNVTVLAFDGIWYSELANFSVLAATDTAGAALELDGNIGGHPYATRGVQAVTLRNMLIDGGLSDHAFTMTRQGGGGGQGSECLYLNVHLSQASFACYYQNGFNALANTFMGGNVQNYLENGMYIVGGTIAVFNTGFQSTRGYHQIENDGFDINVGDSGAYEACVVYGCRTESLRFLRNAGAVVTDVSSCVGNVAVSGWFASTAYGAAAALYKAIVESGRLFVATTEGTSGTVEPDFAAVAYEGTVADNTIVWTHTPFKVIDIATNAGSVDLGSVRFSAGDISAPVLPYITSASDSDVTLTPYDRYKVIDATLGPVTVYLPTPLYPAHRGLTITVKKSDTSANAVTLDAQSAVEGGGTTLTIPGGSRGWLAVAWQGTTTGGGNMWTIVGQG